MKSLMRRIKRRRTSYSDTEPESPSDTFELQSVPDHKKRSYRREKSPNEEKKKQKEEESKGQEESSEPEILLEPPAVILTTPEGLDIDTFAHDGLMDSVLDEANDAEDEWDTLLVPLPLLTEPPKTPTKRRPPPPRPERPAEVDLSFNTFVLGPPERVETARNSNIDTDATFISPFDDPEDTTDSEGEEEEEEEEVSSSWWSAWSSSSSDDATSDSSSSSDSESEEMDLQYTKQTAGKTLYAQLIDGFISFPPLSPNDNEDDDEDKTAMKTFLDGLDEDDVRDAEELLWGEDINYDNDGTAELIRTVASGESDWTNAFSRPVPRWWWLKSSNSFPVYRLGPGDLRHGPSKLRQAVSLVDEASSNEEEEEDVARVGVLYL